MTVNVNAPLLSVHLSKDANVSERATYLFQDKNRLTAYLAERLLAHFHNIATCSVIHVVAYGTKIKGRDSEEVHTHEEADTLIPNQVQDICVMRYVFHPLTQTSYFLLINLVFRGLLAPQTHMNFLTGNGKKNREIDIIKRVQVMELENEGSIEIHNFSGADWGGKFVGITKKTWADA